MKILLLKDKIIKKTLLDRVQAELSLVYKDLGVEFVIEEKDYSD